MMIELRERKIKIMRCNRARTHTKGFLAKGFIRGKRAAYVLPYFVLLAVIIVLSTVFIQIVNLPEFDHYIGKSSTALEKYNELIFIKQLADDYKIKERILSSLADFYKNGAFSRNSPCGSLGGFQLYYRNGEKCMPDINGEFGKYISNILGGKASVLGNDVYFSMPNDIFTENNVSVSYSKGSHVEIKHPLFSEVKSFIDKVNDKNVDELIGEYGFSEDCENEGERLIEEYLKCQDSYDANCVCNFPIDKKYNITLYGNTTKINGKKIITYVNTSYYYYNEKIWKDNITINVTGNVVVDSRYRLRRLSFYKDYDDSLAVVVRANKDLKECRIPNYKEYKLCKNSDEKYVFFDGKYYNDNIPLYFALILRPKEPPKKVEDLRIVDKKNMEDTVEMSFTPVDDAVIYNVYYSDEPFSSVEGMEAYTQVYANDRNTFDLHLDDGKIYYVAVTPVNIFGVENKEVVSVEAKPIDDVAPGLVPSINGEKGNTIELDGSYYLSWEKPRYNVNGMPVNDIIGYYIFYKDYADGLTKEECIQRDGCIFSKNTYFTITGVSGKINVIIVAVDEAFNYVHDSVPKARSGLIWPAKAPLASCYGYRYLSNGKKDWHHGIDIAVPVGTPVKAVADGVVYSTCINPKNVLNRRAERVCHGFGTNAIIYHPELGTYSRYNHLSRLYVTKGQYVKQGDVIGLTGNTGYSEGAHLDFKYFLSEDFSEKPGDYSENPLCYLPYEDVSYTPGANSCRDKDMDGKNKCPVG